MLFEFTVNGQSHAIEADPRETLLSVLRERLGLLGAKYGCGEGECGACTVIVNGQPVASCLVQIGQARGADVLTIEGMIKDPIGQRVIDAFAKCGAVQCGFCTPGFVLSARALLVENPAPTTEEIQQGLAGNLCRCTGYTKIIKAVAAAAERVDGRNQVFSTSAATKPGFSGAQSDNFARPESLDEALELLAQDNGWRIVNGATDVSVKFGGMSFIPHHLKEHRWLDLSAVDAIKHIREDDDTVTIGGGTSYTDLIQSAAVQQWARPLTRAAGAVGGKQIQNMGTLAGNLVNASPAADAVPALYVLDAVAVLRSARGERRVMVSELATGPGQTVVAPDEILTHIIIPKIRGDGEEIVFFDKLGPRKVQTIAIASVALRGWLVDGRLRDARIALGAVAPTVMLAPQTAEYLMGRPLTEERILEAGEIVARECQPIDDVRGSAKYRRRLVRGLLVRGLWPHVDAVSVPRTRENQ